MIQLILFSILIQFVNTYPDGAPSTACISMMPHHDVRPMECQLKYVIQSDKAEYTPQDTIRSMI